MKKFLSVFALAALLLCGCKKEEPKPEPPQGPVKLTSFAFLTQDNPALKADLKDDLLTDNKVYFELPFGTDPEILKSLVPSFTTNEEGIEVTAGGQTVVSGQTALDFSVPVDLTLSKRTENALYTVTVKILEYVPAKWSLLAKTTDLNFKGAPVMAVSPKDQLPYIMAIQRAQNADGEDIDRPVLLSVEGAALKLTVLADRKGDHPALAFSPDGGLYAAFLDSGPGKVTVLKVENGTAVPVGAEGAIFKSDEHALLPLAKDNVYLACKNAERKNCPVARRALNLAHFNGADWENGIAVEGRDPAHYGFLPHSAFQKDSWYLMVTNQNAESYSMYKIGKDKVGTVFENYIPDKADGTPNEAQKGAVNAYSRDDFSVSSAGDLYIVTPSLYFDGGAKAGVFKYDAATGKSSVLGTFEEKQDGRHNCYSIALDGYDTPYVAFIDIEEPDKERNGYVRFYDPVSKAWTNREAVSEKSDNPIIRFNAEGKGYLLLTDTSGDLQGLKLYHTVTE